MDIALEIQEDSPKDLALKFKNLFEREKEAYRQANGFLEDYAPFFGEKNLENVLKMLDKFSEKIGSIILEQQEIMMQYLELAPLSQRAFMNELYGEDNAQGSYELCNSYMGKVKDHETLSTDAQLKKIKDYAKQAQKNADAFKEFINSKEIRQNIDKDLPTKEFLSKLDDYIKSIDKFQNSDEGLYKKGMNRDLSELCEKIISILDSTNLSEEIKFRIKDQLTTIQNNINRLDEYSDDLSENVNNLPVMEKNAKEANSLYLLAGLKRLMYPEGKLIIQKMDEALVDDRIISLIISKDMPRYDAFPLVDNKNSEIATGTLSELNQDQLDTEFSKNPLQFEADSMKKGGRYKPQPNPKASEIKGLEISLTLDVAPQFIYIGVNEGNLKFYVCPHFINIHHEELHGLRMFKGKNLGTEPGQLPRFLEKSYDILEEFVNIKGAKHNESSLNQEIKDCGIPPKRLSHKGIIVGCMSKGFFSGDRAVKYGTGSDPKHWISIWTLGQLEMGTQDFYKKNLSLIELNNCYLTKINFTHSNLEQISLKDTTLNMVIFSGSLLQKANFENASLSNCTFQNSDVHNVIFKGATLSYCSFNNENLQSTNFENATLDHCNFQGTNLENVNFSNCTLEHCNFNHSNIVNANLRNTNIEGGMFFNLKNAKKADFTGVKTDKVNADKDMNKIFSKNAEKTKDLPPPSPKN